MGIEQSAGRALALGTWMAVSLTACGGTMAFKDQEPITIAVQGDEPPPAPEHKMVRITLDHIEIDDKIHFDIDKATIKPESFGLLDEIVAVLQENPRVKKINIIGHTDNDGAEAYNQQLSERRAASVRKYLVEHGVDAARLDSEGRGESDPIASNENVKGREKNRRVEFLITEQETEVTKKVPTEQAAKQGQ